MPPELKAPIQENLSRLFKPVSKDSEPPMDNRQSPARYGLFVIRYSFSTRGITSVSNASLNFLKLVSRKSG